MVSVYCILIIVDVYFYLLFTLREEVAQTNFSFA